MGDVRIGDEDDMGGRGGLGIGLPQSRVGEATRGERVEEFSDLVPYNEHDPAESECKNLGGS